MNALAKTIYIEYNIEKYLLALFLAIFCTLCVAYVYLLSMSVVHVVVSKDIEEKIQTISSDIAMLEAAYMEKQHAISIDVVKRRGFAISSEKIYLNRQDTSVVTQR